MITVTLLKNEQIDSENYKTFAYTAVFSKKEPIENIEHWIKSIDKDKNISHVYINDKSRNIQNRRNR